MPILPAPSRFQSFDVVADPSQGPPRLAALRASFGALGIDGFVLPRSDIHQNEYLPASEERLAWLTGFTGSAGVVLVLRDTAALFVDGRYTTQAKVQVDAQSFTIVPIHTTSVESWIEANLGAGTRLGFDPDLHTLEGAERLNRAVEAAGGTLVRLAADPVDALWQGRPAPPLTPVTIHSLAYAGDAADAKLERIRGEIARLKGDALVVADGHAIAWALNIRGGDVAHTPLPLAFMVFRREGRPTIAVDGRKLSNATRDYLENLAEVVEPAGFGTALEALGRAKATVLVDPSWIASSIAGRLEAAGATLRRATDPIQKLKAVKNAAEIAGTRSAHLRDGAAVTRFLAFIDREAPKGTLDEIAAAEALEAFRAETGALKDISFDTISAAGPNAALPHYRVTRDTNRKIEPGIFLIDSGAQYEDGTTDITRTVAVGTPTPEMVSRNTLVLKGHIAIATALFPRGTSGAQLDPFARAALWRAGLDFDHGTGHGIGSYLSVHEGPQRISKLGSAPLEPGMLLSNEPGYYKEGHFGIRIENLIHVTEVEQPEGAERPTLGFETLTLAPIDRRLIDPALLTPEEHAWFDAYQARVLREIGPLVDDATRTWLEDACRPLG